MEEKINVEVPEQPSVEPVKGRIVSVDVLRGFDMFWIVGGAAFFAAFFNLSGGRLGEIIVPQFEHAKWEGFHFYDLIFPLFAFIVGMSVVFSLGKLVKREGKKAAYKRIIRRFIILYLLGIIYYGGISKGVENIRLLGVLQRLAFVYLFAGILFINLRLRGMIITAVAILLAYWAFLSFVPVPDTGRVSFAVGENWPNYIDKHYLPLFKWRGDWDPEGILSTLPAIVTGLLGVFTSILLLNRNVSDMKKVQYFIGGGAVMVALGYLWGLQFPVIKRLWTSSYVLVAGGYSAMLMGLFYYIVDVKKKQKWALPFIWIGMNPITIYMAVNIVDMWALANRFVGMSPGHPSFNPALPLKVRIGYFLLATIHLFFVFYLVRFMFKRKIFIRI